MPVLTAIHVAVRIKRVSAAREKAPGE